MYCPKCNAPCGEADHYCSRCGCALRETPQPKKGTHIVPILILIILSVIGTVVFFVTRSDTPAVRLHGEATEMPWFQIYEGYVFFDESLYTGESEIVIPSQINGMPVYGLGEGCFENCTDITTVILPETLEEIGSYAFAGCTSLRGIYIPDSVTIIGEEAFSGCTGLEAVTIPYGMEYIGPSAFYSCQSLRHIFYDGYFSNWAALYDAFIGPETEIHCQDGSFSHSFSALIP